MHSRISPITGTHLPPHANLLACALTGLMTILESTSGKWKMAPFANNSARVANRSRVKGLHAAERKKWSDAEFTFLLDTSLFKKILLFVLCNKLTLKQIHFKWEHNKWYYWASISTVKMADVGLFTVLILALSYYLLKLHRSLWQFITTTHVHNCMTWWMAIFENLGLKKQQAPSLKLLLKTEL